jgi:anti-anti-sigma factor
MLTVTIEHRGDNSILRCAGRIVHGQETAIMCAAVQERTRNLVLDLTEVDAIDAAGVGLLVSLQAAGIYLKLVDPSKQVREVLRVTQLDSVFEICDSPSSDQALVIGAAKERSEHPGRALSPSQVDEPMVIGASNN